MQPSLQLKLEKLLERQQELDGLLCLPETINDPAKLRALAEEHAGMRPLVACYEAYQKAGREIESALEMLNDEDKELHALAAAELKAAKARRQRLEAELQLLLLPADPADNSNIFLEIRAGTGGEEAALFAADLRRMYSGYAETRGWRIEPVSVAESSLRGYREIILRVIGRGAYSRLKFESGAHRVQRVPTTESQGRIHTSACTVAVLPEVDAISQIEINPAELRIDTYRASGAGGQHVNKTDSAIRITHLPTNTVVECQDERSQHKNKARALALLRARLLSQARERQRTEQVENRRNLVGSGDRSERIRTYNFPQGRVTDHRINLTLYRLDELLAGNLELVIGPLISEHQADLLASIGVS